LNKISSQVFFLHTSCRKVLSSYCNYTRMPSNLIIVYKSILQVEIANCKLRLKSITMCGTICSLKYTYMQI
jgi:hypothetical protein